MNTGLTKVSEILGKAGPRIPNMHHHLSDPEAFPGEASLGAKQRDFVARIVDVDTALLNLEVVKGKLVRDGLLSLLVVLAEFLVNLMRRRPHPIDLPDPRRKPSRWVVPLRRFSSSVNHESGEESEEAFRFVTLRFTVLNRLFSEVCCDIIDIPSLPTDSFWKLTLVELNTLTCGGLSIVLRGFLPYPIVDIIKERCFPRVCFLVRLKRTVDKQRTRER